MTVALAVNVSLFALAVMARTIGTLDDTSGTTRSMVVVMTSLSGTRLVQEDQESNEDQGEIGGGREEAHLGRHFDLECQKACLLFFRAVLKRVLA